jgi:DNA-binding CsgD family transcriptional regulator
MQDLIKQLSGREMEVLKLIVAGNHTIESIAQLLNISAFTVRDHRKNIYRKLNCHSEADLVRFAYQNGLV